MLKWNNIYSALFACLRHTGETLTFYAGDKSEKIAVVAVVANSVDNLSGLMECDAALNNHTSNNVMEVLLTPELLLHRKLFFDIHFSGQLLKLLVAYIFWCHILFCCLSAGFQK